MVNIKYFLDFLEKKSKIIICIFFITYLLIGIIIFKDYGMGWDDVAQRNYGITTLNYVLNGDKELFNVTNKYHGPVFTMSLVIIEKIFNLSDDRTIYLMRHLVTFLLFFTSVFFFYLLCKYRFKSWKIGLLGSLFLILSPRIFAHSFYNPKDIPFLSIFIISIYTLVRFIDNKTLPRAALHALTCGILIDVRVLGALVPVLTIIFFITDLLVVKPIKIKDKKIISSLFLYIFLLAGFTILFWPTLWDNPIYHFVAAFKEMSRYSWRGSMLYLGDYISAVRLPWHYIPLWIAITTPLLYIGLFFVGCYDTVRSLIRNPANFYIRKRYDLVFVLWFFLPIFMVIGLNSVVNDAWRHMLFVYPGLLMLSLVGLNSLFKLIRTKFKGFNYKIINVFFIIIVALSLINTTQFMVRYHPYQNVYFNGLAGKDMKEVKYNFELDYWGLSYRKALEYILNNDKEESIKIYVANACGWYNSLILPSSERKRLVYIEDDEKMNEAKYFISNYRWHRDEYPYKDEYFSINIGNAKIMVVYKLN